MNTEKQTIKIMISKLFSVLVTPRLCLVGVLALLISCFSLTVHANDNEPALNDSSYYEISTAEQLKWFADKVNSGSESINGVLTADVDLSSLSGEYWEPIGMWSEENLSFKKFKGKFNGQNHVVSGLILRKGAACGLFGITEGATISNIIVSGAQMKTTPDTHVVSVQQGVGTVCGLATASTVIANCQTTMTEINYYIDNDILQKDIDNVGGIVGELRNSTVTGCTADGFIRTDGKCVGGIVGAVNVGLVKNCQLKAFAGGNSKVVGLTYVGGIVGFLQGRSMANAIIDCTVADGSIVTASGVYERDTVKVNTSQIWGTICSVDSMDSEPGLWEGYYEIYTPDQLKWFSSKVNSGSNSIKGKLMNNLNMSKAGGFTPIGTKDKPFAGVFDGQKYTIDSLTINDQDYAGLFGYVKDGSIVNLYLDNPKLTTADNDYLGLVAGFLTQNSGHATAVGYIENCHVKNGNIARGDKGEPQYIGGIVGKMDMSAEVRGCTFQGILKAHEDYIGGIAGCMDSGAKMYGSTTIGPSTVWGDDYVGGVVGYMTDKETLLENCDVDQTHGAVEYHAEGSGYKGLVRGYDQSGTERKTVYNYNNLQYTVTGKRVDIGSKTVAEAVITSVSSQGKGTYFAIVDLGKFNDYSTTEIQNVHGAEELYFYDNKIDMAYVTASAWINMKIDDYAFDKNFKALWLKYYMTANADHWVMLGPQDVYPAGEKMFDNCPNAKIYVDAEYYEAFCNDERWGKYKKYIVPTTAMRTEDVNAEHGARYAFDRNRDKTGSVVNLDNGTHYGVDQVHVIGADDSYLTSDNNNTLWIYQDIGETYDYNTTKIWASSFKGKSNIQNVKFQAITKSARRPSMDFNIAIGDSAFANCENLYAFNVALYSDQDKEHVEILHPKDMPLGKGVFAGCNNLKIYVDPSVLSEFVNDTVYGWGEYKDIIATTLSAWDQYTEAGVKYGHITSTDGKTRYTSKNKTEMEEYVAPWAGQFGSFTADNILCPNYNGTMNYMIATGVDKDNSDIKKGTLKIYNDIGNTYDYKTIALSGTGFRGNQQIQSIIFEDCAGSSGNANVGLSLVIPDGTFEGCSNLKELNMYQLITKGTNHYESIKPSQIFIGKNVFNGVHHDFRIKVIPGLYNDFINDPNWSQYKDLITASEYVPTGESDVVKNGVTYSYASSTLNTISTKETYEMQTSIWNLPIVIAEAVMAATDIATVVDAFGQTAKQTALELALEKAAKQERSVIDHFYNIVDQYEKALKTGREYYASSMGILRDKIISVNNILTNSSKNLFVKSAQTSARWELEAAVWAQNRWAIEATASAWRNQIFLGIGTAAGNSSAQIIAGSRPLSNGIAYLGNRSQKSFYKSPSWYINQANWVTERVRTNVPQMYVKTVADQETIDIMINPGSSNTTGSIWSSPFQTIEIGRTAFHDKNKVKEVKFSDANGANMPYDPMQMVMPDSCFYTCNGLEKLNLVLHSNGSYISSYKNRDKALTPDNFILMGDIFAGCDTTKIRIYVGKEVLQDFLDDDFWGKYKTMYRTVDVEEKQDHSEWSCRYTYTYDNNTMPLVTTTSDNETIYHVDIYAPDESALKSNEGLAALINDYGLAYNYKLDNVKANAFKGNKDLKILDITDSHTFTGDVYSDFTVTLGDSAFAHCPNFEDFNLIYQVTDGTNSLKSLSPSQVVLGKGVFDDCPKLRIKICMDQEDAFMQDLAWINYANLIKPCLFYPVDYRVKNLLWNKYKFYTKLNGNQSNSEWKYIDASLAKPAELKTIFKNGIFRQFDEFRAFQTCGLDSVYDEMFSNCLFLQSITLPDSINYIGSKSFAGCEALPKLTIPAKVSSIGDEAFTGSAIKEFIVENPKPADINAAKVFSGLLNEKDYVIYVPDSVVNIYREKWAAVANHINSVNSRRTLRVVNLTKAGTLKDSLGLTVTTTSDAAKHYVTGMMAQYDSLRISGPLNGEDILVLRALGGRNVLNELNYIGCLRYLDLYDADLKESDFCYNTQNVDADYSEINSNDYITEDNYVTKRMFCGMTNLETLILPRSATKIGTRAFDACPKLNTLVVGDNVIKVEENAGMNCPNMEYLVMLPETVPNTHYTSWAFHATGTINKTNLTGGISLTDYTRLSMIVPPVTGENYFKSTEYTEYTADSISILFHDQEVFKAMKKAHIFSPNDLVTLRGIDGKFNGNTSIKEFNELLITSIQVLGNGSFTGMKNMTEVTLPMYLSDIKEGSFEGCSSLKNINVFCQECPTLVKGVFDDLPTDFVITVTQGYEDQYRKAWPEYASHIKGYRPEMNIREITLKEMNTLADSLNLKVWMSSNNQLVTGISGDMSGITALKVNGPIGSKDLAVIRMLAGREPSASSLSYSTSLKYLNLYDAQICKDDIKFGFIGDFSHSIERANEVPSLFLYECYHPQTLVLPKTATKINSSACYDMYSLKSVVIGDKTTYIDDDAFGECDNLKTMIFLCDKKPTLDDDAFTDPIMYYNDVHKVDKMYVRKDIIDDYTSDKEYTQHANNITSVFSNDDLFRAYGSRGIGCEDDLASISAITGWFTWYDNITDLSSLKRSNITTFNSYDVENLASLQRVTLPSTVKTIGDETFANNTKLSWVDLSECDSLTSDITSLGLQSDVLLYAPSTASAASASNAPARVRGMYKAPSTTDRSVVNTVYTVDGKLVCDEYHLPTTRDYDVPRAFTANKIVLDREFTPQTYTTLALPFGMSKTPAGFKFFKLNQGQYFNMGLKRTSTTEVAMPYVVWTEKDQMVIDVPSVVNATQTGKSLNNEYYNMVGTLSGISNSSATAMKALAFDSNKNVWNLVPADDATTIAPFSAYAQVRNTAASNTDVPNVFLDPQYFYSVGTDKHMLDGDDVKSLSTDEMTLIDGQDFTTDEGVESFTADNATYSRTMTTTWGTLCLPYNYEAEDNETCEFYEMKEKSDNSVMLAKLKGTVEAGRPVMVRRRNGVETVVINASDDVKVVKAATEDAHLTGSFSQEEVPSGAYIISKDKFRLVGSSAVSKAKVNAYRSYISASAGAKAATLSITTDDETTAIEELNNIEDGNAEYYDAEGRRLDGLQKGLNIVKNGNRTIKVVIQ